MRDIMWDTRSLDYSSYKISGGSSLLGGSRGLSK